MIVVDASVALLALLNSGQARQALGSQPIHAPHLIDSEVASGLRRKVAAGHMSAKRGWGALDTWRRLGVVRYPVVGLLDRIWQLRANVSAYDASYVALAEALGCPLLTADRRLAGAPGLHCQVNVAIR